MRFITKTKPLPLAIFLACQSIAPTALAESIESINIVSTPSSGLDILDSLTASEARINALPGGASVIDLERDLTGQVLTTADQFRMDPGVYAQSGSVPFDTRLSIRGSGATRRYGSRGLTLLIDGMPANNVDGSFYTRAYDPLTTKYISVARGANGLSLGGSQIGGAVNFVQKNGRTDPGLSTFVEAGSFETFRTHASYGLAEDNKDTFISATWGESNGYREKQDWRNVHLTANHGFNWGNDLTTRFYVLYSDSDAELASGLSKFDAYHNPKQSKNDEGENRDLSTFRLSQKTTGSFGATEFTAFTYYQILDFDHLTRAGALPSLIDYDTDEVGVGFRTTTNLSNEAARIVRTSVTYSYGENEIGGQSRVFGFFAPPGPGGCYPCSLGNDYQDTSENIQTYVEYEHGLTAKLSLIAGTGWQYAQRERELNTGNSNLSLIDFTESYEGWTPRIGFIYKASEHVDVFANLSQSFEAPALSEARNALKAQEAVTYEIGSRFDFGRVNGEITYYSSDITDDFIDFDTGGGSLVAQNMDTERQGIESGLNISLLGSNSSHQLWWENVYRWSDFTFDGGTLSGNTLPGIAEHNIVSRLRLTAPNNAWDISLTAEHLSSLELNNANDLPTSKAFTIYHVAGEAQVNKNITLTASINNITDKQYVNTVTVNPFSNNPSSSYSPGNGIEAYLGVKVNWN